MPFGTQDSSLATAAAPNRSAAQVAPRPRSTMFSAVRRQAIPTAQYLMRTEVHTYAFSVAANAILSFFPFIVLLLTLTRRVFHSQTMYDVVLQLLRSYLPAGQDFIVHSVVALTPHRGMKI